jgi:hypothetical protein
LRPLDVLLSSNGREQGWLPSAGDRRPAGAAFGNLAGAQHGLSLERGNALPATHLSISHRSVDLTALANKNRTDKGTVAGQGHGYSLLYDLLFAGRRLEALNFCEIGLCIGGPEVVTGSIDRTVNDLPSIKMWQEYFPNAKLYGVDISDFSSFETDRFKFVRADAGDEKQLQKVADLGVPFDVIIDDGSHAPFHQQRAFLSLFPTLRPGGLFIIEDIQWQPSTYSQTLPRVPRTDVLLNQFVAGGRFSETGALPLAEWKALESDIKGVFLIDEDWLTVHRRQYNGRHRLKPDQPSFADPGGSFGPLTPRFWKKILGHLRADLQGPDGADRRPRVKLAIIQKA